MTKVDMKRIRQIEREEYRRNHPGAWQDAGIRILFGVAMVLTAILILYWSGATQVQEVEAAVFHKEAETIAYVEKIDSGLTENAEIPPEAIEVEESPPEGEQPEIGGATPSEPLREEEETVPEDECEWVSAGRWKLTAYCPERCCNGKNAWRTASGAPMVVGRTVAVGHLPFGTRIKINDHIYVVEDRGVRGNHVDILHSSHRAALNFGLQYAEVFIEKK